MGSMLHIVPASAGMAVLCTMIAWAVAGAAVASWGSLPVWLGAIVSGVVPVLGLAVIVVAVVRARRSGRPAVAGQPPWSPSLSDPTAAFGPPANVAVPMSTSQYAPPPAYLDRPLPFPPPAFALPAAPGASNRTGGSGRVPARYWFSGAAALLAVGLVLSLFVGTWVRVSLTDGPSTTLDAWDIGVGDLILVSALEFAVISALAWRWHSRWAAVLAAFAGTWWVLVWWVGREVSGGLRRLAREGRGIPRVGHASISAGTVWDLVLGLALGMLAWGLASLAVIHSADGRSR